MFLANLALTNKLKCMKVISTNIGERKKVKWKDKEVYTGIYKYPTNKPITLGITDVENDFVEDRRYHGGNDKACYLYSADHYAFWKAEYPNLDWQWGMFGENLTIQGLDEDNINIGDVLKIGDTEVQVTQPRQPCFKLNIRLEDNQALKRFIQAEKPGIYVRVLKTGKIKSGDTVETIRKFNNNPSVNKIYHFLYNPKENIEGIKKAIEIPELAESCRNDLKKLV